MAEVIARHESIIRGLPEIDVSSAGTSAWEGATVSDGAMLVAMEHQLDLGAHRARQLTAELVANADLILTMGSHHLDRAIALGGEGKSALLTDYAEARDRTEQISDPFGGDLETYRGTFAELRKHIRRVFDRVTHA